MDIEYFGKKIKSIFKKNSTYEILDKYDIFSGGTFTAGACYPVAQALLYFFPESEIVQIKGVGMQSTTNTPIVQHIVLDLKNGFYMDADGLTSLKKLLKRMEQDEMIVNPYIEKLNKKELGNIKTDPKLVSDLIDLIKNEVKVNSIKTFEEYVTENYQTKNSGNWLVYTKDKVVVGCDLTYTDANILSKKKGEHNIIIQDKQFNSIETAQTWLDSKSQVDVAPIQNDIDPLKKVLSGLITLLKKRFNKINPFFFAHWISKTFGVDKFLFISKVDRSQHINDIKWVYCKVGDYYFDMDGFYQKDDLLKKENLKSDNFTDFAFVDNINVVNLVKKQVKDLLSLKEKQEVVSTIIQFKKAIK